jgi:hypothetical protein
MQEIATPSTPASGYKSIYPKTDGKLYTLDDGGNEVEVGSGGGSGGINYMVDDNTSAETSVGDWLTYADAAGENPVDGTAGSATTTYARTTNANMRGTAEFTLSKDAANRQGEGASCAFTVDVADKAKRLTCSFDYDASHAGYADDDIRLSVYDVTNSKLIRVNGEDLKGGKGSHIFQFQTASDSVSYRLIMHVSSTSAVAYDVHFDNIQVGPRSTGTGNSTADSMVRLHTGNGHGSTNTKIRRFSTEVSNLGNAITYADSATLGASFTINEDGVYNISYNDGLTSSAVTIGISLNSTELSTGIAAITSIADRLNMMATGAANFTGACSWSGSLEKGDIVRLHGTGTENFTNSANFTISRIGDVGVSSEDLGGREIVVEGAGNGGTSITANTTNIDFTETLDTVGAFDGTTFTVPETGSYIYNGSLNFTTSPSDAIYSVYKNGTLYKSIADVDASGNNQVVFSLTTNLTKGDLITLRSGSTLTLSNTPTRHYISINKLASPQTILETETVAARYTSDSGQSILDSTITTKLYEDLVSDTHGAYNTATGEYTVPISGHYSISASILWGMITWTVGERSETFLYVDGVQIEVLDRITSTSNYTFNKANAGSCSSIYLDKGAIVTIRVVQNTGSTRVLWTGSTYNVFSIARVK